MSCHFRKVLSNSCSKHLRLRGLPHCSCFSLALTCTGRQTDRQRFTLVNRQSLGNAMETGPKQGQSVSMERGDYTRTCVHCLHANGNWTENTYSCTNHKVNDIHSYLIGCWLWAECKGHTTAMPTSCHRDLTHRKLKWELVSI